MSKKRLKALEQAIKRQQSDSIIVVFRDISNGKISIPSLGFIGLISEGEEVISKCQQSKHTIINFNIPRPSHLK